MSEIIVAAIGVTLELTSTEWSEEATPDVMAALDRCQNEITGGLRMADIIEPAAAADVDRRNAGRLRARLPRRGCSGRIASRASRRNGSPATSVAPRSAKLVAPVYRRSSGTTASRRAVWGRSSRPRFWRKCGRCYRGLREPARDCQRRRRNVRHRHPSQSRPIMGIPPRRKRPLTTCWRPRRSCAALRMLDPDTAGRPL